MNIHLLSGRLVINLIFLPVVLVMCYLNGVASVVAFLTALVLHESAHAVVASALGVKVRSLEVMPFGCTANIESFAVVSGGREIAMAAAGPAINILAAAAVFVFGKMQPMGDFSQSLFRSNVTLAAINLIPALPLDGGRILSALLSLAMPPLRAVKATSVLGMVAATLLVGLGVYMVMIGKPNPTMLLMGGFMLYSSFKYLRNAAFQFLRNTTGKREEILTRGMVDVKSLAAHRDKSVGEVLTSLDARRYNVIYVLDDDLHIIDKVNESDIMRGVVKYGTAERIEKLGNQGKKKGR